MPRKKVEEPVVDEAKNIALALKELCEDKGLSTDVVIDAMSEALKKAYFKYSDDYPDTVIKVNIDLNTGNITMAKTKNVVEEIQDDVFETDPEEAFEQTGVHYNVGDVMETPIDISAFRRAAAMQAKSVFKQKLREAEKQQVITQYSDKVGDILTGVVEAVESQHCIVRIGGHTNAYLSKKKMLPGESLRLGNMVKVYVEEVDKAASGAPIIVSRIHPRFVTRLMEQEISEIAEGIVEIKGVARQPGSRSKVAVYSKDPNIDPSGSCIGPRGSRIGRVLSQINNEKIDVVNYNENPLLYVADALKPATIVGVMMLDEENKACRAIVTDDQYSLAIGKEAQNVNLAVRLTGWKIDIKSVTDAEAAGYQYESVDTLKTIENAKKSRSSVRVTPVKPVVEEPVFTTTVEPSIEETPVKEEKPVVTPVVEETPVTPVVEEKPVVRPTRKTANIYNELEAALSASTPAKEESKPARKKFTKKTTDEEEIEEKPISKKPATTPSNALPVYTEEELRALQEEEEAEEAAKYSDDVDYDEFDDYYDDEK